MGVGNKQSCGFSEARLLIITGQSCLCGTRCESGSVTVELGTGEEANRIGVLRLVRSCRSISGVGTRERLGADIVDNERLRLEGQARVPYRRYR